MLALVLVGLDPLAQLKKVHEDFVENFNVGIVTGMVGTLDPHQVPRGDVEAQLVAQGDFPAFHRKSLLSQSRRLSPNLFSKSICDRVGSGGGGVN
jgi:hypothetical protein